MAVCSFQLSNSEVHLWTLRIEPSTVAAASFESVLAGDEKERAARFRFDHLRHSFVIARGMLRYLLGRYLGALPAGIRFDCGRNGKPSVRSAQGIEFNTTRSGGLAAFAFTVGCQIGVDIEQIRPLTDAQHISDAFFCREESADIMSLPASERERAFFRCWTRKEAYIKATGDGLSMPLDDFQVTIKPNEPAQFIHLAHDTNAAKAWTLHDLCLASDYAAAVAYRAQRRSLSVFPIADTTELIGIS